VSEPKPLKLDEPGFGLAPAVIDSVRNAGSHAPRGVDHSACGAGPRRVLEGANHAYVLQGGRSVLSGPACQIAWHPEVQRIYPRGQRCGGVVIADCRAGNVPTTGIVSEVMLT
jgi:branched-chain amino acid transport system ATP-binding protein